MNNLRIARTLPDIPRWVEARALLLQGDCEISGVQENPELSFVFHDSETDTVFVIGEPGTDSVHAAVRKGAGEVIASWHDAARLTGLLPGYTPSRIIVYTLNDPDSLPEAPDGMVRFLDPALIARLPIDEELRRELETGAGGSPIAALFVAGEPVSFCYAGAVTESLWDIAIDTLPEHQQKGYAGLCAAHMIRYMHADGRRPVWQALEENPASWRLAEKLGFMVVDELGMFVRSDL